MNNSILKKAKTLVFALTISGLSFGQLNNCINTKEHPLIKEIIDTVKANPNHKSILAYAITAGDRIGLARSTILNLAYAWASCKKIKDSAIRKEEEFKYLDAILSEDEFERLVHWINVR
jgi:hypothetical protein